jgi:hypothetical protein
MRLSNLMTTPSDDVNDDYYDDGEVEVDVFAYPTVVHVVYPASPAGRGDPIIVYSVPQVITTVIGDG